MRLCPRVIGHQDGAIPLYVRPRTISWAWRGKTISNKSASRYEVMKSIIIYASLTGNTKKVAQPVHIGTDLGL